MSVHEAQARWASVALATGADGEAKEEREHSPSPTNDPRDAHLNVNNNDGDNSNNSAVDTKKQSPAATSRKHAHHHHHHHHHNNNDNHHHVVTFSSAGSVEDASP